MLKILPGYRLIGTSEPVESLIASMVSGIGTTGKVTLIIVVFCGMYIV